MSTTCKTCGRAVYKDHVDAAGNCIFCEAKPPQPSQSAQPK